LLLIIKPKFSVLPIFLNGYLNNCFKFIPNICDRSKLMWPALNGASIIPTSRIRTAIILSLKVEH